MHGEGRSSATVRLWRGTCIVRQQRPPEPRRVFYQDTEPHLFCKKVGATAFSVPALRQG